MNLRIAREDRKLGEPPPSETSLTGNVGPSLSARRAISVESMSMYASPRAGSRVAITLQPQYQHRLLQNGMWTYSDAGPLVPSSSRSTAETSSGLNSVA